MVTYRVEQHLSQDKWHPIEGCIAKIHDAAHLAKKAGHAGYRVRIVREADCKVMVDAPRERSEHFAEWFAQLEAWQSRM